MCFTCAVIRIQLANQVSISSYKKQNKQTNPCQRPKCFKIVLHIWKLSFTVAISIYSVALLTCVARLRVHGNHHFASSSSPGSQRTLQSGDTAGNLISICSWNITIKTQSGIQTSSFPWFGFRFSVSFSTWKISLFDTFVFLSLLKTKIHNPFILNVMM